MRELAVGNVSIDGASADSLVIGLEENMTNRSHTGTGSRPSAGGDRIDRDVGIGMKQVAPAQPSLEPRVGDE